MKRCAFSLLLILNVLIVYSNHFHNDFQFDDTNAIPNNPAIRQSSTIFRAFADPKLFSAAPTQRTYRPLTTASLALDYWIAGGFDVFFFHLSTFIWFSLQLVLMFLLFENLMDRADPHPSNFWTALAAAALFGMHPVNAETVNFIIQRSEVYNALGCVAGLWLFVRYSSQRRFGWYLIPVALAILAKPPALVFPLLLFAYVLLFETPKMSGPRRWKSAALAAMPSLALACAAAILLKRMQPRSWNPGTVSAGAYRLTQPLAVLHYFKSFFLPTGLNVDAGWHYAAPASLPAIAGYLFVLGMVAAAIAAARSHTGKPIAFGLAWFLIALLPTSLMPLGDITNDHRMFFAFVGLTLAVFWTLRLALFHATARLTHRDAWVHVSLAALVVVLILAAEGTRMRNRVWLTHRSLWSDSVAKNPRNDRALSNYGSMLYEEGDYETAFRYWERALAINPAFARARSNLVLAAARLHRTDLMDRYLLSMVRLYPSNPLVYSTYADWLASVGRFTEAVSLLDQAQQLDPQSEEIRQMRIGVLTRRDAADRILLFRILDADHNASLSPGEIVAAPAALLSLDRNGDGELTPEECGASFGDVSHLTPSALKAARVNFMRANPLLWALDSDHDGVISAAEIHNADKQLQQLDRNRDGSVESPETVPGYVYGAALRLMKRLDWNRNGRIDAEELNSEALRGLFATADLDKDGNISLGELTNDLFYRADRDRNGVVTRDELAAALREFEAALHRSPSGIEQ